MASGHNFDDLELFSECSACNKTKSIEDFSKNQHKNGANSKRCKLCVQNGKYIDHKYDMNVIFVLISGYIRNKRIRVHIPHCPYQQLIAQYSRDCVTVNLLPPLSDDYYALPSLPFSLTGKLIKKTWDRDSSTRFCSFMYYYTDRDNEIQSEYMGAFINTP